MIEQEAARKSYFRTAEGHKIAYITHGSPDNPPLVFVHGWISHLGLWDDLITQLQASYYCVAVDLLGHGNSDKPRRADYSIPAHVDRIQQLIAALDIRAYGMIGHSMGGLISVYTALHHDAVKCIVNISGILNGKLSPYVRHFLTPLFALGAAVPPLYRVSYVLAQTPLYIRIYDNALFYEPYDVVFTQNLNRLMTHVDGIAVPSYKFLQAIARCDLSDQLSRLSVPMLTLFGKQDNTVPPKNGYLAHKRVPDSRLIVLDQCGHVPIIEKPDETLHHIRDYLADINAPKRIQQAGG